MIDQASVPSLMGSTVRDSAGEKIGKVGQVYLDDTTGQPEWVTVRTGLFGTKESFVPLAAARVEGDELVVDILKSKVHEAPRIEEEGHLSEEQETELYSYYGVSQGPFGRQPAAEAGSGYVATDAAAGLSGAPVDAGSGYAAAGVPGGPADPTGTPLGDQDVAQAMGGTGFTEADPGTGESVGPDFARGEDASVTGVGGGTDSGPDFARGEDSSVTGAPSALGPDFARGTDVESAPGVAGGTDVDSGRGLGRGDVEAGPGYGTDAATAGGVAEDAGQPGGARRRLRRWMVTDEQASTPVVDESGQVIGEVSAERVDVRPLDEDGDGTTR